MCIESIINVYRINFLERSEHVVSHMHRLNLLGIDTRFQDKKYSESNQNEISGITHH